MMIPLVPPVAAREATLAAIEPWLVQTTTEPSFVVPPLVAFHDGWLLPEVPAVVTFWMFRLLSRISF